MLDPSSFHAVYDGLLMGQCESSFVLTWQVSAILAAVSAPHGAKMIQPTLPQLEASQQLDYAYGFV